MIFSPIVLNPSCFSSQLPALKCFQISDMLYILNKEKTEIIESYDETDVEFQNFLQVINEIKESEEFLSKLGFASFIQIIDDESIVPKNAVSIAVPGIEIYIPFNELVDIGHFFLANLSLHSKPACPCAGLNL